MMFFLVYPIGLVLAEYGLHYWGMGTADLVIAVISAVVVFIIWAEPGIVLTVSGAEAAIAIADKTTRSHVVDEVKKIFFKDGWYLAVLKNVLLASIFLPYVLGTLPLGVTPAAFFGLLGAVMFLGVCIWKWPTVFAGHKGKRIAFGYAVVTIVFWLLSLVPGPVWVKYMPGGWDPSIAKPTKTEDAVYRLEKTRREMADADRAKELDRITKEKILSGKGLSPADGRFIAEAKRVESSEKSGLQMQTCLPISSSEVHRCVLSEKPRIFTAESLASAEAVEFCIIRPTAADAYVSRKVGVNKFEVVSTTGTYEIEYKAMRAPCPDKL
jgi:hypothetical protein